jgi:hypothetical protein
MFFRNVAVYQPTRLCSFETSLSADTTMLLRNVGLPADTTMFFRNIAVYQPTWPCSFETSLSTSRHDYVLSKLRCLAADTTRFFRNVAVYQSHHAACKTTWCRFPMSRISFSTHKSFPKILQIQIARHDYNSIGCCVQFSVQSVQIVAPICLSSVNFLITKHPNNQIFKEFYIDKFYKNLLQLSRFGQNQTKVSDFTWRPECVAVRR